MFSPKKYVKEDVFVFDTTYSTVKFGNITLLVRSRQKPKRNMLCKVCVCEVYKTLSKRKWTRVHHLRKRPKKNLYWFFYRNYSQKYESIVNVTYYWFLKRKWRSLVIRFQFFYTLYFYFGTLFLYWDDLLFFLYDVTLKHEDLTKRKKKKEKKLPPRLFSSLALAVVGRGSCCLFGRVVWEELVMVEVGGGVRR